MSPTTLTPALQTFYDQTLPHLPTALHGTLFDLTTFFNPLLTSPVSTISTYVSTHPIEFTILILSLLLSTNPLAIAGFAGRGVAVSSAAAAWQSSMGGHVASGSLFSVLQSVGARHAITIPVVAATAVVVVAVRLGADEMLREVVMRAGEELGKMDVQKVYKQMARGAGDGWKKVGGEDAARQMVRKATEELKALEASGMYGGFVGGARQKVGEVGEVAREWAAGFTGVKAKL